MWHARTLADEFRESHGKGSPSIESLESSGFRLAATRYKTHKEPDMAGPAKVLCPGCNIAKNPFQLIDARSLDFWPHDWVCDGCRYIWHRHEMTPVQIAETFGIEGITDVEPLTIGRLAELLNAPAEHVKILNDKRQRKGRPW